MSPRRYRNLSIQNKMIGSFLILIFIPIIVYYVIFDAYSFATKNKEMRLIEQLNSQAVDSIELYINNIMRLTMQPLYNRNILNALNKINGNYESFTNQKRYGFYDPVVDKNKAYLVTYEEDQDLSDLTTSMRGFSKYIFSTFLFHLNGDALYYSLSAGQLVTPYKAQAQEWFQRSLTLNGSASVSSDIFSIPNISPEPADGGNQVFAVSREIKDVNSVNNLGVFSIFLDVAVLKDICSKIKSVSSEDIVIVNSHKSVIYDAYKNKLSNENRFSNLDLGKTNSMLTIDGKSKLLMVNQIPSTDWKLVRFIPVDALTSDARIVERRMYLVVLLLTLFSFLISVALSYGITNPLKKLNKAMKLIEKGDLSIRFRAKNNDEIGQLGKGFDRMIGEIETLINDVYVTRFRKKEAELNALQAQINPHFISNTLESIRMMARMNKDMDTAYMISILGSLLRYSINTKNQFVKVNDELEHLKNYLILQNRRFEDKFELVLDIPEHLLETKLLKLVLQPVVENAIYHALESSEDKGIITITAQHTSSILSFEIKDNGIGMTEEQLETLIQHANDFTSIPQESRGIGLRNVNERIKLYCGESYGLQISSSLGRGTVVKLTFPSNIIE